MFIQSIIGYASSPRVRYMYDMSGRGLFAPLGKSAWSWLRSSQNTCLYMGDALHAEQCTHTQQDRRMTCIRERVAWPQAKARTWPAIGPNEGHKQFDFCKQHHDL